MISEAVAAVAVAEVGLLAMTVETEAETETATFASAIVMTEVGNVTATGTVTEKGIETGVIRTDQDDHHPVEPVPRIAIFATETVMLLPAQSQTDRDAIPEMAFLYQAARLCPKHILACHRAVADSVAGVGAAVVVIGVPTEDVAGCRTMIEEIATLEAALRKGAGRGSETTERGENGTQRLIRGGIRERSAIAAQTASCFGPRWKPAVPFPTSLRHRIKRCHLLPSHPPPRRLAQFPTVQTALLDPVEQASSHPQPRERSTSAKLPGKSPRERRQALLSL